MAGQPPPAPATGPAPPSPQAQPSVGAAASLTPVQPRAPTALRTPRSDANRRSIFALVDGALGPPRARPSAVDAADARKALDRHSSLPDLSAQGNPLVSRGGNYSRKDKSLGVLCEKFIANYGAAPGTAIPLDAVADGLGVERRRIYDIINVLESLGVVRRQAKNMYEWNSIDDLTARVDALKEAARRDPALQPMPVTHRGIPLQPIVPNPNPGNIAAGSSTRDIVGDGLVSRAPRSTLDKPTGGNRKEKSLGILCQKFVQLFLVSEDSIVGLDEAASRLSDGPSPPELPHGAQSSEAAAKLLKTKVRRLYDIANVLCSLNLIHKVPGQTRKPCFQWIGVEENTVLGNLRITPIKKKNGGEDRKSLGLPPLKRHVSTCAGDTRRGATKRRKSVPTDRYAIPQRKPKVDLPAPVSTRFAPPAAIAEHIPPEYHELWEDWVAFAQTKGNNPSEAANAIARAASAAEAAVAKRLVASASNSHGGKSNAQQSSEDTDPAIHPSSRAPITPVATRSGPRDGSCPVDSNASTPGMMVASSPVDSIPSPAGKRQGAISTPVRLMAAKQLSALSRPRRPDEYPVDDEAEVHNTSSKEKAKEANILEASLQIMCDGDIALPQSSEESTRNKKAKRTSPEGIAKLRPDVAAVPTPPTIPHNPYKWTAPEHIAEYMAQARAAGPQYAEAAEKWLTQVRQWQSLWGPLAASLGGSAQADSRTDKGHTATTD